MKTSKAAFLDTYQREHHTTMRVLRAYPADQLDLRPHPKCKTARELAWVFVLEQGLGAMVLRDEFAAQAGSGRLPAPPDSWDALLAALEQGHEDFVTLVQGMSDVDLGGTVKFMTGPKTMGDVRRIDFCWFLLHDQIHHRGQFSIYLRMAGAKVPSIYGPSADEPWM